MDSIEQHIEADKEELANPQLSPQRRRHIEGELEELEAYAERHPEDHHDPSSLELYCDNNPSAPECLVYDD
ncbi:carbon metabolic regulator [Synechococcus phage S-WAM2]|jgi:hypothetical protein|uniref:Carbon metabolic regulator n=2 Tax=Kyanoviridae TaxID=2946160 RepID=A0A1D8KSU6_9CAUD|nr:conserved hypothetical cyanobacterial protein [Synechococcus phage S-RSM4]YP_009324174.1 carbon metabolic regulator [Synechococcus phage S-WAM2]AOV61706.1 carbon metabolic regulator [Synechococcus phage S-WAM2]CAR63423.1 conserved hypothetical cyanobacterial protein [Synechococcus phage S-RSM4]